MNCLPCFNRNKGSNGSLSKKERSRRVEMPPEVPAQVFNFRELAMATKNFRQECLLGEGGFGRVFKGTLQESDQVVAVKQLDRNGMEGSKEFSTEVSTLNRLKHPNLVDLIGYCADGDQRLLVYEYLSLGSLDKHLFGDGPDSKPLDWVTRMKIASGAAQGLEYLHEKANPPMIYGDVKPSNILLGEDFEPKLSDVGLAKLGASDATAQPQSRAMGTFGHSAPEYSGGGEVSLKSDIYSFGVVLLELITGRRAIDTTRPTDEQNLVTWAQPFFRDPKRFSEMADPRLNKQFPATSLNQAVGIVAMCLQDEPMVRPLIGDVTSVLSCISMMPNTGYAPPEPQKMDYEQNEPRQGKDSTEGHRGNHGLEDEESEKESGSHSQSDDSEEDSTDSCAASSANGKPRKRAKSSRAKNGGPRQTVVTFKEPSTSSRYSPGGKPKTPEESSSSSEVSSSESSDDCDSAQSQGSRAHSDATENGFSSREVSDSCLSEDFNSPERLPRRRGAPVSAF